MNGDDPTGWPDGWVCVDGQDIAVEVVEAFERYGEKPESGSIYAREHRKAERAAQLLYDDKNEVYPAFGVADGRAFAIDPRKSQLPVSLFTKKDVSGWIAVAVKQKIAKRYANAPDAILGINLHHPFRLEAFELRRIADAVAGHPFREIWVVNGYGDPAQRVPSAV